MNIIEWRNHLCQDENISSRAKHIGLTLTLFFRNGKKTYPSIDTLCLWTSLAPNTVSGALKDLQKCGYIDIKSYRLPNARFRGHEYVFLGLLSNCNTEENYLPPSNFAPSNEVTIEPAIEPAIEPSNFAYKEEEENKEKNKKERKKGENFVLPLPDWLPLSDWNDYLEMRNKKGKGKATNRAKQLVIIKLDELRRSGQDPGAILQQSIINSWTSVFEIKGNYNANKTGFTSEYRVNDSSAKQASSSNRDRLMSAIFNS